MNATRQTQQHTLICHDALIGASLFMMVMAHCVTNASPFRPLLFSVYVPLLYVLIGYSDHIRQNQTPAPFFPKNLRILLGGTGMVVFISLVDYCRLPEPSLQAIANALVDDVIRLLYLSGVNYGEHGSVGVVWFLGSIVVVRLVYRYILRRLSWILTVIAAGAACLMGVFLTRRGIWLPLALDISCVGLMFYTIGDLYAVYRERIDTTRNNSLPCVSSATEGLATGEQAASGQGAGQKRTADVFDLGLIKISTSALCMIRIVLVILFTGYWLWCLHRGVYIEMAPRSYQNMHSIVEAIAASYVVIIVGSAVLGRIHWLRSILSAAGRHPLLFIGIHGLSAYLAFLWNMADPFSKAILECAVDTMLVCMVQRAWQILGRTLTKDDADTVDAIRHWYAENVHRINALFYVAFTLVLVLEFQQSTMFTYRLINWTTYNRLYMVGMYALMVVVVLRFWNRWDRRQLAFRCLILGTGIMLWTLNGHRALLVLCMLIVAADGAEARRVLQIYIAVTVLGLAAAYLASMKGYIPWLTYDVHGHAMGSNYRTDHAAHWLYLFMAYRLLRGKRMTVIEYAIQACLIYYVYHLTTGKTFLPCAVLFLVLCMLTDYMPQTWRRGWMRQCASRIGLVMFVICTIFTYAVSLIGGYLLSDSDLLEGMSLYTIGSRIKLSYAAFLQYPIRLFSQYVYEQGAGGVINQITAGSYFFLDSMYVRMLIIYGVTFLVVMLAVHTHMMYQSVREHNTILWCALFVIAIDSIMEHHMTEFAFNILPVTMWANSARRPLVAERGEGDILTLDVRSGTSQRVEWIDAAKGITILLVILGHTDPSDQLGILVRGMIFSFHMPLFFALSVATYRQSTSMEDWIHKTRRAAVHLLIPVLVFILISALWSAIRNPASISNLDYWVNRCWAVFYASGVGVTSNTGLVTQQLGVCWFFIALFVGRSIYDFAQFNLGGDGQLLIVSCLASLLGVCYGNWMWMPLSLDICLAIMPIFYFGSRVKSFRVEEYVGKKLLIFGLVWIGTLAVSGAPDTTLWSYMELATRRYPLYPLCMVTAMAGIIFMSELSVLLCRIHTLARPFLYLGRNSLYLLIIHALDWNIYNTWYREGHQWYSFMVRLAIDLSIFTVYMFVRGICRSVRENARH